MSQEKLGNQSKEEKEALFFLRMGEIASGDVDELICKGREYGDSWKRRGGIGAFMMLARKWDRIENLLSQPREHHDRYDILQAMIASDSSGVADDVGDLRRYLFLVETEASLVKNPATMEDADRALKGNAIEPMADGLPMMLPPPDDVRYRMQKVQDIIYTTLAQILGPGEKAKKVSRIVTSSLDPMLRHYYSTGETFHPNEIFDPE